MEDKIGKIVGIILFILMLFSIPSYCITSVNTETGEVYRTRGLAEYLFVLIFILYAIGYGIYKIFKK